MPVSGDVKKAIELLRAHPERAASIAKLARSCGVAPRTLQKHFKKFVGKTPAELRFEARMDRARRELLRAKPNVSIATIAASCGIKHLGRFAAVYRLHFGETPSATLRRRFASRGCCDPIIVSSRLERPVIAIHSFACVEPTPALAGFDLIGEISASLMRDRWLAVGSAERARYHSRGNIQRDAKRVRITAMLTSSETGRCLWADRWEGSSMVMLKEGPSPSCR